MQAQQTISQSLNEQRIGTVMKVLVDRKEGQHFIARTEFDSPEVDNEVLIDAANHRLRTGTFCHVRIHDASAFDLHGSLVSTPLVVT
jgi:ribosomal protein S12 methylthiotransferase